MKFALKSVIFSCCMSILIGCATIGQQAFFYNEILVINNTSESIRDVLVRVTANNKIFRCGNVAPHATCSTRFSKKEYQENPVSITWVYSNMKMVKNDIVLRIDDAFNPEIPLRGVLEIEQDGSINTYFSQNNSRTAL